MSNMTWTYIKIVAQFALSIALVCVLSTIFSAILDTLEPLTLYMEN